MIIRMYPSFLKFERPKSKRDQRVFSLHVYTCYMLNKILKNRCLDLRYIDVDNGGNFMTFTRENISFIKSVILY